MLLFIHVKRLLKKYKTESLILLFVGLLSLLFTYNYILFKDNMSIGEGHVYVAKSIALSHNFNVDEYWGNSGVDVITYKGHKYLPYAPLNSVLMASSYFLSQLPIYIFVHTLGPINGIFSLIYESLSFSLIQTLALMFVGIFTYINLFNIKSKLKNFVIVTVLLGTILFTYSVSFFNHIVSAMFVFAAFTVLTINKKDGFKKYLISGILTGLAFLAEYPTILFSISVLIYTLAEYFQLFKSFNIKKYFNLYGRKLLFYSFPIVLSILIQLILNKLMYHDFFLFGETIFKEARINNGGAIYSFSQNLLFGLYGMYLSPLKGLFVYSPFLLFSIFGFKKFYQKDRVKFYTALSYITIISLLYSTWSDCFGATTIGTRYMVSIIPFIGLFVGYGLIRIERSKILKSLFILSAIYSIITILIITSSGIASYQMGQCKNINLFGPGIKLKVAKNVLLDQKFSELAPVLLNAK